MGQNLRYFFGGDGCLPVFNCLEGFFGLYFTRCICWGGDGQWSFLGCSSRYCGFDSHLFVDPQILFFVLGKSSPSHGTDIDIENGGVTLNKDWPGKGGLFLLKKKLLLDS